MAKPKPASDIDSERPPSVEGRRVYCAWKDCGNKLEKGRAYYCLLHDFWPR